MKISRMITELQRALAQYGDLPITTYDGEIGELRIEGSKNFCRVTNDADATEIFVEIKTKWSRGD